MEIIRVLLVKDNAVDVRKIKEMLGRARGVSFKLGVAQRLSTARRKISKGDIDIVLLDLHLPDSQGLLTFQTVHDHAPLLPVVVISSHANEELAVEAVRRGAQDYLVENLIEKKILVRTLRYAVERKKAADALRLSEANLKAIIENNADGILIVDRKGKVGFINPAAEALFGREAKRLVGKNLGFPLVAGETSEFDIMHEGGGEYVAEMRVSNVIWEGENAFLASLRDITERKRLEEELKQYAQELEVKVSKQVNELIQSEKMASLGQLVAGVAHEVNNPLAFIKSNSQFIEKKLTVLVERMDKDEDKKKTVEQLLELMRINIDGIDRIATITRTLKRFAKSDSEGKVKADINEGIRDTLVIVHNQLKHRVEVHEDYGKIPKTICNLGQLNQVFMNLILNSSQAIEQGDIWIRTWNDEKNIYIEIRDNGCGIPEDRLQRVFDPFFITKDDGTGFGLSISYRIIVDHAGDIRVKSAIGEGTTMTIVLPIEV